MPYRDTAYGLAALGRGGDDTLVHMNRDEVQGLQALAMAQGGSLTINPYTGMPEAFSLKKIFKKVKPFLPTIAGAVTSAMGMGPAGAALVGGATGAATSKGNLLQGFAMGALGGWGGAGLYQGLVAGTAGAGVGASESGAVNLAKATSTDVLSNVPGATTMSSLGAPGVAGGAGTVGGAGAGPTGMLGKINTAANNLVGKMSPGVQSTINNPTLGKAGIASLMSASALQQPEPLKTPMPMFQKYDYDPNTQKFTYLGETEEWNNPYAAAAGGAINDITAQNNYLASLSRGGAGDTDIDGFTGEARYAEGGSAGVGGSAAPTQAQMTFDYLMGNRASSPRYGVDFGPTSTTGTGAGTGTGTGTGTGNTGQIGTPGNRRDNEDASWTDLNQQFINSWTPEQRALRGGEMGNKDFFASLNADQLSLYNQIQALKKGTNTGGGTNVGGGTGVIDIGGGGGGIGDENDGVFHAKGGAVKRGRYMKGPGDGVSDSIPAVISTPRGKRPAKLAAGEFVFPARVVAEIGNGSSDAGARELYAMMDRIERRMKQSKRGKDSGARNELIA